MSEQFAPSKVLRSREIVAEVRRIKSQAVVAEEDIQRVTDLTNELITLCPPVMGVWRAGNSVMDLWDKLLKVVDRGEDLVSWQTPTGGNSR